MTNIPFPHPTTRAEARGNALHWLTEVERIVVPGAPQMQGESAIAKAQLWARIAETFPPDPDVDLDQTAILAAESPVPVAQIPADRPMSPTPDDTIVQVSSVAWDVLRVLAMRYLRASLADSVTVDLSEQELYGFELRFVTMPDTGVVTCYLDRVEP